MMLAGPRSSSRAALALVVLFLAACVTAPNQPTSSEPSTPVPVTPPLLPPPVVTKPPETQPPLGPPVNPAANYPKSIRESGAGAGVLALVKQAQDSQKAGKVDAAIGQLERALRIEAKNPFVWQALAEAHVAAQHADQGESAARKSSSLGRGNPYIDAENWRVIAAARALRNDGPGALQASTKADEISARLPAASSP